MRITVADHVSITDADDFKGFAVVSDLPVALLDAQLRSDGLGRASGDYAWISAGVLRERASAQSESADWAARFDAMIAFAADRGWWDGTRRQIRAHIEAP